MKCDEVMKRTVHCAGVTDTVQSAARAMRDRNVGFLPVCEVDGRVVGTLTDRDIAIRLAAEDGVASQCLVSDFMSREVVACRPSDDLSTAEQLMATHRKSRILVVDDDGAISGVISLSDVVERDTHARAAVTMRNVATREAHR
jgi:CBS domain-containing protein